MQTIKQAENTIRRCLVIGLGQILDRILCSGIEAKGAEAISCTYYENFENIVNSFRVFKAYLIINTKAVDKPLELEEDIRRTLNKNKFQL